MYGKFEPKLTYRELGDGKVKIRFQWRQRASGGFYDMTVDLDIFKEYQQFAEASEIERFRHLGNAVNWDTTTDPERRLVFLTWLLLYFPFSKVVKFQKEA